MTLTPSELTVLATLGGAVVGALPSTISLFVNKNIEVSKQFNELVVKAAIESWKSHVAHSKGGAIFPLEHYIIHTSKMCELALNKNISPENVKAELHKINDIMKLLEENALKVSKQKID